MCACRPAVVAAVSTVRIRCNSGGVAGRVLEVQDFAEAVEVPGICFSDGCGAWSGRRDNLAGQVLSHQTILLLKDTAVHGS